MQLEDEKPKQPKTEDAGAGTTFTINLGDVELTDDEVKAVMNDITQSSMKRARALTAVAGDVFFGRFGRFGWFGRIIVLQ